MKVRLPDSVISSVLSQEKISGAPHDFYRYPGRFSPRFVQEVVKAFTRRGDLVLDPFCGGGTTVVEAMALGRKAAGIDINSLATFLTQAKTTPISVHDKRAILAWLDNWKSDEGPTDALDCGDLAEVDAAHYHRNIPDEAKAFFGHIVSRLLLLPKPRQQAFVRLVLLSVGQRALDCRDHFPTFSELKSQFAVRLTEALSGHFDFLTKTAKANAIPRCRLQSLRRVINRPAEGSEEDGRIPHAWLPAKLVLTSPPYPGVHVVYHRWQLFGRWETPVPFWLANRRDGAGESFYTLGTRKQPQLTDYFERLESVFRSVRGLVDGKSLVVQLVAFSDPTWQLPSYLKAMENAGFREADVLCEEGADSGRRLWRQVPGRKWYAKNKGKIAASREVLLVHRPVP